jgi:hypothetical protein
MFYCALHLLDSYLCNKNNIKIDVDSHPARNAAIRACPELGTFRSPYRSLQDVSEQVRYDPGFTCIPEDFKGATRNLEKVISILEPKVKRLLGA